MIKELITYPIKKKNFNNYLKIIQTNVGINGEYRFSEYYADLVIIKQQHIVVEHETTNFPSSVII